MAFGTHQHHDGCYTKTLVCRLQEHSHSHPGCYTTVGDQQALTCITTEHSHTQSCYQYGPKTCGQP